MKKLLLLSFILFTIVSVYAQTGEIKGVVKDKGTGEPIFGATVHVEVAGSINGTASNPDGKYTIKPINTGLHTVFVSVIGYKRLKIYDVLITSGKITYVNVDMEKAITNIDEFKVVAKRFDIPLIDPDEPHVKMISLKEIEKSVQNRDPIAIAATVPGVTLAPNGKDVYVRGARPQSTQFITDGMKSITGGIGINGQAIGSMKVYTGGVPAQYGDLTGGVIVVETKSYFDLAQRYK